MPHSPTALTSIQTSANLIVAECDVCKQNGTKTAATIDGPTVFGPWAYMCDVCASTHLTSTSMARRIVATV